jgi:hypothetical protein
LFSRGEFEKPPDFEGGSDPKTDARIIEGCLILAFREKDPHLITGQEENLVRLLGLHIKREDLADRRSRVRSLAAASRGVADRFEPGERKLAAGPRSEVRIEDSSW